MLKLIKSFNSENIPSSIRCYIWRAGMVLAAKFSMVRKAFMSFGKYGAIAAVLFCIPFIFFIRDQTFSSGWLLYLGNSLFLCFSFIFAAFFAGKNDTKTSRLNAGFSVVFTGVIFSCIISLLCVLVFASGLFHIGSGNAVLENTPAALPTNYSHGIWIMIFASAIIGNGIAGSFGCILARGAIQKQKA